MKILRYLVIAIVLGGAVAALLLWQQQPSRRAAGKVAQTTSTPVEQAPTTAAARLASAPEPTTKAHRQAAQSLAQILTLPSQFEQNARLYALIMASDSDALLALIDEAAHLASPMDRAAGLQILLSRYVELEPELAIARAKTLRNGSDQRLLVNLYLSWIRHDETAAVQFLLTQPKPLQAQVGSNLRALNRRSGDNRYQKAYEVLASSAANKSSNAAQLARQAKEDPAGAWTAAQAETNLRERQRSMQRVLHVWARSDPQAALNALASLPSHQRNRMQMNVVGRWLQQDPDAALTWINAQGPGLRSNQLQTLAVTHIAQTDISRALRIAATLPQGQSQLLIDQALSRLAADNPERVIEELNNAGIELANSQAYAQILSNAKLYSVEESLDRARQLDEQQRQGVEQQLYRRWAEEDPAAAARHLANVSDAGLHERSVRQVIRRWANADPTAAASWIATAPEAQRDAMQQVLVTTISQVDPDTALTYLADIRSPSRHDQAAAAIMSQLVMDLPAAEAVLDKMQTETGRQQGAALLYQTLKQFNSPDAERYKPARPPANQSAASIGTTGATISAGNTAVQIR